MTGAALWSIQLLPYFNDLPVTRPYTKSHDCRHYAEVDSFSNGAIVDSARHQIDQEIVKLNDSVRALKSRRNALAPISRLPPEMLSKIFTFCASIGQTDYASCNTLSWIKVSHICHHWRAVALECPSLWSCLVFSRPKWAEEMLKRSKMAPLVIKANLTYMTPKMVEAVQSALEHISRTRELHITASTATIEKLLTTICGNANHLQSFCLSNPQHNHYTFNESYILPDDIFNGVTPHLKRLELIKCNLRWSSPLLSGLTHLKIHDTDPYFHPTITELISVLEKMPKLETLDLQNSLPSLPDAVTAAPSVERVIDLPHLSYIRIDSSVLECANVLNHLSFPTTTSIHLTCLATETTDNDFSSIFPTFSNMRGSSTSKQGSGKPLRSLYVQNTSGGIRVQAWTSAGGRRDPSRTLSSQPRIDLGLTWRKQGQNKAEQVMTAVCKALPLAHLTSLHMCHLDGIGKDVWLNTFGALPKLRNVRVQGNSVHGLIEALVAEVGEKQQADLAAVGRQPSLRRKKIVAPPSVFFPGLHYLVLDETDFDENEQSLLDPLINCLMERCERKAEVRELILVQCSHLEDSDVELLEEIVVDVGWDGIVQGFSDSEEDEEDEENYYDHDGYYGHQDFDSDDDDYYGDDYGPAYF